MTRQRGLERALQARYGTLRNDDWAHRRGCPLTAARRAEAAFYEDPARDTTVIEPERAAACVVIDEKVGWDDFLLTQDENSAPAAKKRTTPTLVEKHFMTEVAAFPRPPGVVLDFNTDHHVNNLCSKAAAAKNEVTQAFAEAAMTSRESIDSTWGDQFLDKNVFHDLLPPGGGASTSRNCILPAFPHPLPCKYAAKPHFFVFAAGSG